MHHQSTADDRLSWSQSPGDESPLSEGGGCSPPVAIANPGGGGGTPRWSHTPPPPPGACPQCTSRGGTPGPATTGRYASLANRTTSLNSYGGGGTLPRYKDHHFQAPLHHSASNHCNSNSCGVGLVTPDDPDDYEDEEEEASVWPALREVRALRVPALRGRAIASHHYPEGGWGWLVCAAGFLAHLLTTGLQLAFGLLYLYTAKHVAGRHGDRDAYVMHTAWMGALCLCTSFLCSPLIVAICRRKSTRLTAVLVMDKIKSVMSTQLWTLANDYKMIGGLVMPLACLFTSFAVQYHQALLSYGVVLGAGAGIVRETSGLVLAHYFKRRRAFVEMVVQAGAGVGVALFSVLYKEAVGKLGWRLGLQAVTGLLIVGFFLGIVYRPASLYHPQRRAIMHLKNQRKKVKEKKTHIRVKKPPLFDFSPLRSRPVRVLLAASATAALGLYTPVFYLAFQGFGEGLEDSALVLLQTFLGFAMALGCVGFGLLTVRPSSQCLISRQYLCQVALLGIGVSVLSLSVVQGYHGYALFASVYGTCLGGFMYSIKMFTLERVRARHFTKAWGFVRGAEAIPVLIGVPIAGYINQAHPKAGYYFSCLSTFIGAGLLFFVGYAKKPEHNNSFTSNLTLPTSECICPAMSPQYNHEYNNRYTSYPPNHFIPGSNHYERLMNQYNQSANHFTRDQHQFDRNRQYRHSFRLNRDNNYQRHQDGLHKSISYAAHMDFPEPPVHCITNQADFMNCNQYYKPALRPSKSVPEGLARWDNWTPYRRPVIRNVQVIEQITTSV